MSCFSEAWRKLVGKDIGVSADDKANIAEESGLEEQNFRENEALQITASILRDIGGVESDKEATEKLEAMEDMFQRILKFMVESGGVGINEADFSIFDHNGNILITNGNGYVLCRDGESVDFFKNSDEDRSLVIENPYEVDYCEFVGFCTDKYLEYLDSEDDARIKMYFVTEADCDNNCIMAVPVGDFIINTYEYYYFIKFVFELN